MAAGSLDKYRKGYVPPEPVPDIITAEGIKLVPYKAFVADAAHRSSYVRFRPGLYGINKNINQAFPYGFMTMLDTDGNGFVINLLFSLPSLGPMAVQMTGSGLEPLFKGLLTGSVSEIQIFDPARFLPVPEGDWDTPGHKWVGEPLVKEMLIYDKPLEVHTAH